MSKPSKGKTLIHFVFTPKYRLEVFGRPEVASALTDYIHWSAKSQGIEVRALAVQPEHVHIMCHLPRTLPVSMAAQELKRFPSLILRRQFPEFRQLPGLWGRRYFHRSVGGDSRQVQKYIDQQMRRLNT